MVKMEGLSYKHMGGAKINGGGNHNSSNKQSGGLGVKNVAVASLFTAKYLLSKKNKKVKNTKKKTLKNMRKKLKKVHTMKNKKKSLKNMRKKLKKLHNM